MNQFTNLYPQVKTISFELKPQGKTEEIIKKNHYLEHDFENNEIYKKMVKTIDLYHRSLIQDALLATELNEELLEKTKHLYNTPIEDRKNIEYLTEWEKTLTELRKETVAEFYDKGKYSSTYEKLSQKELITTLVPTWIKTQNENLYWSNAFDKRTTYFSRYNTTRKHLYDPEGGQGSISYRAINDNLLIFLENQNIYAQLSEIYEDFEKCYPFMEQYLNVASIEKVFSISNYNNCLTQNGIMAYNAVINGYTTSDNKIQGLNEIINLHNQKSGQKPLPLLKKLQNQILFNEDRISFIPKQFETLQEVFDSIKIYQKTVSKEFATINSLFKLIDTTYDKSKIYIQAGKALNSLSQKYLGSYEIIEHLIDDKKYISIEELESKLLEYEKTAESYNGKYLPSVFVRIILSDIMSFSLPEAYRPIQKLLEEDATGQVLHKHEKDAIKKFLDTTLDIQRLMKLFAVRSEEMPNRDYAFYNTFFEAFDLISTIVPIYNKTRNFLTKKPYKNEKVELSFGSTSWLSGWEKDYKKQGAYILKKDNKYYLLTLISGVNKKEIEKLNSNDGDAIRYVYYKQKIDNKQTPRLFFYSSRKKNLIAPAVQKYNLPFDDMIQIYDDKKWMIGYAKKDPKAHKQALSALIDYYKLGFSKHEDFSHFQFNWKETSEYENISEFYNDTAACCFKMEEISINFSAAKELVSEGKALLFQIHNKDYNEKRHGKKLLHTMYWEALFDPKGQNTYTLNSGATMYFRKASINKEKAIIHPANQPIHLKNPNAKGQTKTFSHDIVKDKRYTEDKYQLSVSLTANYKTTERINQFILNTKVNQWIRKNPNVNIIGIHRGERNLVHITIMDQKQNILFDEDGKKLSFSMNVVKSSYQKNGQKITFETPYQEMLSQKAKQRPQQRKDWDTVSDIKNIKSGYLSKVIGTVANLAIKYNAIIVLEDLDSNFKSQRSAIEKDIYRTFERDLINKLSFMVSKDIDPNNPGGLFQPLQLTMSIDQKGDMNWKQNGIVFFVNPYKISQIDPSTGFVNLFPKCYTAKEKRNLFASFDSICYKDDQFIFEFDYRNIGIKDYGIKSKWQLSSAGNRHYWNKKKNNNKGGYEEYCLTDNLCDILDDAKIDYKNNENISKEISNLKGQSLNSFYYWFKKLIQINYYNPNEEYLLSPVIIKDKQFDSRLASSNMPDSADANGSYNIARKGSILLQRIQSSSEEEKPDLFISKQNWLEAAQS